MARFGFLVRGAFHPLPDDGVPGQPGTLVLIGNAGPALWRCFAAEIPDGPDPLDRWTRVRLDAAAAELGARALYPFDGPPWLPFQRWAMRAEAVHPSPFGPLIHPEYGPWHAWRGALAFPGRIDIPEADRRPSPCAGCVGRPCLAACPAGALDGSGYDVPACRAWLAGARGAACLSGGCLARHACPVGRGFAYLPAQAEFHMRAFLERSGLASAPGI